MDDLRLEGALGALIQEAQELGVVAQQDRHVVPGRAADQIENVLVLVLVADQIDLIEYENDAGRGGNPRTSATVHPGCSPWAARPAGGQDLEAGIVLAAVGVGERGLAVLCQTASSGTGQNALARAPGAEDQDVVGDPGLLVAEQGVDRPA